VSSEGGAAANLPAASVVGVQSEPAAARRCRAEPTNLADSWACRAVVGRTRPARPEGRAIESSPAPGPFSQPAQAGPARPSPAGRRLSRQEFKAKVLSCTPRTACTKTSAAKLAAVAVASRRPAPVVAWRQAGPICMARRRASRCEDKLGCKLDLCLGERASTFRLICINHNIGSPGRRRRQSLLPLLLVTVG
jgi:hypothetical protein